MTVNIRNITNQKFTNTELIIFYNYIAKCGTKKDIKNC